MTPSKTPTTKSVSEFLEELVKGTHQGSVDDILHITKVIRTARETLSEEDFRDLRDRWVKSQGMDKGGQNVWSTLLRIGLDDRLEELKDHLPCTYTTLHLVHCLSDEELKVGVAEGHIHPKVSQGSLNRWVKYFRFEGQTEEVPEDFSSLVKVLGPASVSEEVLNRWGDTWKVKTFKKVATGLGYQVNPGRDRFQKVVNGVTEDWYRIVPAVQPSNPLKGFVDTPKEEGSSGDLRDFFTDD